MKISDIQKLSDGKLSELLCNSEFNSLDREHASTEINRRLLIQSKKNHWSVVPIFFLSLIAALTGIISLVIGQHKFQEPPPEKKELILKKTASNSGTFVQTLK